MPRNKPKAAKKKRAGRKEPAVPETAIDLYSLGFGAAMAVHALGNAPASIMGVRSLLLRFFTDFGSGPEDLEALAKGFDETIESMGEIDG